MGNGGVVAELSMGHRIRELATEAREDPVYRHAAIDGTEQAFSWAQLDSWSSQLAGALSDRGLGEGERLFLALRNSPQLVAGIFAAWKLGAVPVPARWDMPDWELERVRKVVSAAVDLGAADLEWIDSTSYLGVPPLPDAISPHVSGILSSGSTGTPKVILSARRAVYDPLVATPLISQWRTVPRPETILVPAPMYHANGFATLLWLLAGDRLVVMEKFDAARVVDLVERHRVSTFTATPTMLQRIADLPGIEHRDLSSIEWILQGAAPMPDSLMLRWVGLIGAERIVTAYGMTEGLGTTALRGDEWMDHRGSVGRPRPETEVRILDAEGKELPPGSTGEIYLRSPTSEGYRYIGDVTPLARTDDGFQTAGDLGWLDDEGYLYVVDRRADLIVTGGANVYPAEVESALIDNPKIADVVVIGLRDDEWGRRVHALVEPADSDDPPSADEVVEYARTRLAAYKVPKTVEIVEAIPRTAATKINRHALAEARGG